MIEGNGSGIPQAQPVQALQPVLTIIPAESCSIGITEEVDPISGRTYRDLIVQYPNGMQFNIRFYDLERARTVGRGLIKRTPKDERGVEAKTPLADSMRAFIEKDPEV